MSSVAGADDAVGAGQRDGLDGAVVGRVDHAVTCRAPGSLRGIDEDAPFGLVADLVQEMTIGSRDMKTLSIASVAFSLAIMTELPQLRCSIP